MSVVCTSSGFPLMAQLKYSINPGFLGRIFKFDLRKILPLVLTLVLPLVFLPLVSPFVLRRVFGFRLEIVFLLLIFPLVALV